MSKTSTKEDDYGDYEDYEEQEDTNEEEKEEEEEEEEGEEPYEITPKMVIRLKETFQYFDEEKNNYLPTKMIGTMMRFVGFTPTEAEIKYAIKCLYIDPRGTVDFGAFFHVVQLIARDPEPREDIIELFKFFDEQDKGWVPTMVLKEALTTLGDKLKNEEVSEFFKLADSKKKGKIKYETFVTAVECMANRMPPILDCDQPPPEPKKKFGMPAKKK